MPSSLRRDPWPAIASLVLACSATPEPVQEADPEPRRRPSVDGEELCEAYCERAVGCGIVPEACAADCPGKGRDVSGMRREYVGQLLLCLDGASCNGIKSQQAWSGCHDAVVSTLSVTSTLRRFCFLSARRAAKCDRRDDADQADCLTRFRYQDDAALEQGLRCLKQPCGEVPGCLARHLIP